MFIYKRSGEQSICIRSIENVSVLLRREVSDFRERIGGKAAERPIGAGLMESNHWFAKWLSAQRVLLRAKRPDCGHLSVGRPELRGEDRFSRLVQKRQDLEIVQAPAPADASPDHIHSRKRDGDTTQSELRSLDLVVGQGKRTKRRRSLADTKATDCYRCRGGESQDKVSARISEGAGSKGAGRRITRLDDHAGG
jgi:hypothetical protein